MLEYSFYKMLESQGLNLETDVLYESMKIPYFDSRRKQHVYIPDFVVPSRKIVYEVKPASRVMTRKNDTKATVARKTLSVMGFTYCIVTEKTLDRVYKALEALDDPDTVFTPNSLKKIKRKKRKK